jgi:hypothetical protein
LHRQGFFGGIHVLEFYGPVFPLVLPEKVDFGPAVSAPEEDFLIEMSNLQFGFSIILRVSS